MFRMTRFPRRFAVPAGLLLFAVALLLTLVAFQLNRSLPERQVTYKSELATFHEKVSERIAELKPLLAVEVTSAYLERLESVISSLQARNVTPPKPIISVRNAIQERLLIRHTNDPQAELYRDEEVERWAKLRLEDYLRFVSTHNKPMPPMKTWVVMTVLILTGILFFTIVWLNADIPLGTKWRDD